MPKRANLAEVIVSKDTQNSDLRLKRRMRLIFSIILNRMWFNIKEAILTGEILQFRHYRVWVEEEVVGVSCPWGGLKAIRTLERRREGI